MLKGVQHPMRMYKKLVTLVVLFTTISLPVQAEPLLKIPATFSLHGAGYGHGVGMSQMGARAMALAGESPEEIIKYFYKDVEVESIDDTEILRVNIGHVLSSAKISTSSEGAVIQLFSGDIGDQLDVNPIAELTNKSVLNFSNLGANVLPSISVGKKTSTISKSRSFTVRWSGTRYLGGIDSIISVNSDGASRKYRYGQIQVRAVKDKLLGYRLELTNSVRLSDEYMWGVSEMSSFWPTAALEAQAIASRTYALSKADIYRTACDCDLYGGISDQVFLGYAKESEPKYGALWKEAVTRTSGLAITQEGKPISAYFFSSSGGKTEVAVNAWGSERAYTQIVEDPGSLNPLLNPRYASWDRIITQAVVASAFALPDVVALEVLNKNASGTVGQIIATSSTGLQVALRGETFRSRTKIPSAYFDLVHMQN